MRAFSRIWANLLRILAIVGLTIVSTAALAQQAPDPPAVISPLRSEPDPNGVNITDGQKDVGMPVVLSTPADPRLTFDKVQNSAPYISGTGAGYPDSNYSYSVHTGGGTSESFQCIDADCQSVTYSGSVLKGPPGIFQQAGSGDIYRFDVSSTDATSGSTRFIQKYAGSVDYPDGETITYAYDSGFLTGDTFNRTFRRPNRISSNTGYYITVAYQYTGTDISQPGWSVPAQAALYAPDGTLIRRLVYNSNGTITDYGNSAANVGGRTFAANVSNGMGGSIEQTNASITLPSEASPELTLNPNPTISQLVASVVRDGITWSYAYLNPRSQQTSSTLNVLTYDKVTVTGPNGYNVQYAIALASNSISGILDHNHITSRTDALGHVTSYSYDSAHGDRLVGITMPEGNSVSLSYDSCGNVFQKTTAAKPGTGLANLNESATYDFVDNGGPPEFICPNVLAYRPLTYTDALGRVTNYTYNADGQMTQELTPGDSNGVRRETDITYALSGGTIGISRKTLVRVCGNTTTCAGNAESHTEYTYFGQTNLPLTVTQKDEATGATRTTTYTYDAAGRPTVIDGALAGTDDAKYFQYDTYGRKIWEVGERGPNGLRLAKKFTYRDSDDNVTSVQTGTVSCVSGCDTAALSLTLLQQTDTTYDSRRYAIRDISYKVSTSPISVTDRSFLDRGLADCTTVRMNLASLPAVSATGACTLGTQNSAGPDRITKNLYDNAGQLLQVQKAVGTSLQENYVTYTYTPNGKQQTVTDANGNKAQFVYDGFDRLSQWQFPSKTTPGTVDTADFEQYGYDAAGNRTSLRKRDGSTIGYAYDGLNRMISKIIPTTRTDLTTAQKRSVFTTYDMAGRQLGARFDSIGGADGVTNTYDGFGELTSSTLTMGTFSKTLTSAYDAAGNRTQLTHPDGSIFTYAYDALGRLSGVYQGAGTSAPYMTFAYGNNALVSSRSEAGGSSVGYGYDDIGRLTSQSDAFVGGTGNVNRMLAFNPASEIATETRDNNSYAFPTAQVGSVNRTYAVNGLNQYTSAGPASFTYDANGNLVTDGTWTYTYDVENRLVHAVGAGKDVTLTYDPSGRLFQLTGSGISGVDFLYDGDALVGEYSASTGAMTNRYVHGSNAAADDPLIWFSGSGVSTATRHWLHADHLGSIVAISDGNGASPSINSFDEYGIPASANNTSERFGYTGQAYLSEIGLDYYKARMYSPTLGRFLQTDPVGYKDQINLYAYVGDDPVDREDPSGLDTVVEMQAALVPLPLGNSAEHRYLLLKDTVTGETLIARGGPSANYEEIASYFQAYRDESVVDPSTGQPVTLFAELTIASKSKDWNTNANAPFGQTVPGGKITLKEPLFKVEKILRDLNRKINSERLPYHPQSINSNAYAGAAFHAITGTAAPTSPKAPGSNLKLDQPIFSFCRGSRIGNEGTGNIC